MDWFDAFDEIFAIVERFVQEHGKRPSCVVVSPNLYTWLAELQRESALIEGIEPALPLSIDTTYGTIPVVIDERLGAYDVAAE
ncbi:MAG: hypothetical protein ACO3QO_01690 [Candidatus Kapaibacteriota bacterium]